MTGASCDDGEIRLGSESIDERPPRRGEVLREVEHHGAEIEARDDTGGDGEQVDLVVPAVLKPACNHLLQADDLLGQPTSGRQLLEGGRRDVSQRAVSLNQRLNRGGVVGNVGEQTRLVTQRGTPGARQHRRGKGTPLVHARCGPAFGEPVEGADLERRDARASSFQTAGERSPGDDTGEVRRHEDRDPTHRVVRLGVRHNLPQHVERAPRHSHSSLPAHPSPGSPRACLSLVARRSLSYVCGPGSRTGLPMPAGSGCSPRSAFGSSGSGFVLTLGDRAGDPSGRDTRTRANIGRNPQKQPSRD